MARPALQVVLRKLFGDCMRSNVPFQLEREKASAKVGFRLLPRQVRFIEDVLACRTVWMGGRFEVCEKGHHGAYRYLSCRNRNCPICRTAQMDVFLARQREKVLDVPHHHVVFTIPHELSQYFVHNWKLFANVLFEVTSSTLMDLLKDPKWLGATPGVCLALHTWGQQLQTHPHIHAIVTSGGLSDDGKWVSCNRKDIIPQNVLMIAFRGRLLAKLRALVKDGSFKVPAWSSKDELEHLIGALHRKYWNTKVMDRYDHALGVVNYLARYLRGGPIGNSRILDVGSEGVTFAYLDRRDASYEEGSNETNASMTLSLREFGRRLLTHIPPKGFHAFRSFGLYASTHSKTKLAQTRELLGMPERVPPKRVSFAQLSRCPHCGEMLVVAHESPPYIRDYRRGTWKPSSRGPPFHARVVA